MDHQKFITQGKRRTVNEKLKWEYANYHKWARPEVERISGLPYKEFYDSPPKERAEMLVEFIDSGGDIENISRLALHLWALDIEPGMSLPVEEWVRLFRMHGYYSATGAPLPEYPTPMYRGALPEHSRGLGWTTNLRVAAGYCTLRGVTDMEYPNNQWVPHRGRIFMALVSPNSILAHETTARIYLDGDKSFIDNTVVDEYILDPRNLRIAELGRHPRESLKLKELALKLKELAGEEKRKTDWNKIILGSSLA